MPCVDAPNAACPHDIRITVAANQTAVASGQLLRQTWAAPGRKTFHFSLPHATVAAHVAFAAGTPLLCRSCMSPAIAIVALMRTTSRAMEWGWFVSGSDWTVEC